MRNWLWNLPLVNYGIYLNSHRGFLTFDIYNIEIQYQSDLEDYKKKWQSSPIWLNNMGIFLVVQFNVETYVFIAYNEIFIKIIQKVDDY